jgi:hypothetical protein
MWDDFAREAFIEGVIPEPYSRYVFEVPHDKGLLARGRILGEVWLSDAKKAQKNNAELKCRSDGLHKARSMTIAKSIIGETYGLSERQNRCAEPASFGREA